MPYKRSPMRYAHITGFTSVTYQADGERIISYGHDGDFRIWDGMSDDDPPTTCVGENVWAALQYGDRVLIATDLNTVQAYKYPSLDKDGIEFRFTAFATGLAMNKKYVVAGSEDCGVKVLAQDDGDQFEFDSLEGPVLSMDVSRKDMLAVSSGDGSLRVWDLKSKELMKEIGGLPKAKSFEAVVHFSSPTFEPTRGDLLAYPKGKEIIVVSSSNWTVVKCLKNAQIAGDYTCCQFSSRGDYIAAGSDIGELSVWEYSSGKPVAGENSTIDNNPITRVVWCPKSNGELAISDANGQIGTVANIYVEDDAGAEEMDIVEMAEKEEQDPDDLSALYSKHIGTKTVDDDSDEDNENCFALDKLKSQVLGTDVGEHLDNNGHDDDDGGSVLSKRSVGGLTADVDDDADSIVSGKAMAPIYPSQVFFQPSATPDHLADRYLVYNHVGIVRRYLDDDRNSIEVDFHDSQVHNGMHLINNLNHSMAGLSESVLALACGAGQEGGSSKLVGINLVAFGNREWSYTMPNVEEIVGVAASDKIIAVVTDTRMLRIFTSRGTQREVISIPGPPVSLAAYGDHILVAYHSAPANEDQHINLMLITCVRFKLRCREVRVPLAPGAELRWLGYSDKGSPAVYDSAGILRLYHASSNLWFPILDADKHRRGASDSLFIIRVSESIQMVQLIVCRGATYPFTTPKPIPLEVGFQQPMCDMPEDTESQEDKLVRAMYFKSLDADKAMKEATLTLFAAACKSEMEQRAKEIVETVGSSQVIVLAIKYASKLRRIHLVDSLSQMLSAAQEQGQQEEEEEKQLERDNASIVWELQQINAEAVVSKENLTPKIKPLPMGGNPFRRKNTPLSSPATVNPLEHLTGKAIGFSPSAKSNGSTENTENQPQNGSNVVVQPGSKFMPWFEANKEQLKRDHPNASDADLTKIGMRQFRSLQQPATTSGTVASPKGNATGNVTEKRKLDETDRPESGVSKLAKFGFVKQ